MSDLERRVDELERRLGKLWENYAALDEIVCELQLKLCPSLNKDNAVAEGEEYD